MAKRDLTTGSEGRRLLQLGGPMTLGVLGVISVGFVDALVLGQVGTTELAAVGFIYPLAIAFTSLSIGLSAGAAAVLSNDIGAERPAERTALQVFGLGAAVGLLAAAIIALAHRPMLSALGASGDVYAAAIDYFAWWCASFPFLVAFMAIGSILRAHGDATAQAVLMVGMAAINIALTPIFVFGSSYGLPIDGAAGAGAATFVARVLALVAALAYAARLKRYLRACARPTEGLSPVAARLARVAGPSAASNAINPTGLALVTAAVATLGDAAVAGFGAATRVQSVLLVPMLALSGAIGPLVGQNWGAQLYDRARRGLAVAWAFSLAYGAVAGLALAVAAEPLLRLLTDDADAVAFGALYLRVVGWTLFGYGMLVITNGALNGREAPTPAFIASAARVVLVYVPLAWLGVTVAGEVGLVAAAAFANVAGAVFAVLAARSASLGVSAGDVVGAASTSQRAATAPEADA